MVELSRSIANKIKDKQGDITEDEVRTCNIRLSKVSIFYTISIPENYRNTETKIICTIRFSTQRCTDETTKRK